MALSIQEKNGPGGGGEGGSGKNRFHWLLIDQSGAGGNKGKIKGKK